MFFKDRIEAGKSLAIALNDYANAKKTIVLGLPRGGVVVASEVAHALNLPLDVIVPRKIGAPGNPELAIGAIAGNIAYLDEGLIASLAVSHSYIERVSALEKKEAERRLSLFRKGLPPQNFKELTLIVVDDGIATGSTMKASLLYLKKTKAAKIVAAVPVGPADTINELKSMADEVVCLFTPDPFYAVGQFYKEFPQTSDEDVMERLKR